jgi:hypothetical protein
MSSSIDTTRPHPARRYNFWLGGKDHFAADRESGDAIATAFPGVVTAARANRDFLHRAVRVLSAEYGVRQFLDVGTGIPTAPYLHEVAAEANPDVRTVYVDNDRLVLAHARALMTAKPPARAGYILADLREPDSILTDRDLRAVLDLDEPVGVLLVAVLHFFTDDDKPARSVSQLMDAMPAGSFLVLSHATFDLLPDDALMELRAVVTHDAHGPFRARSRDEVSGLLGGLRPIPPGLVLAGTWRPEVEPRAARNPGPAAMYAVVACKPERRP